MNIKIDNRFKKKLIGAVEGYRFSVGVEQAGVYKRPLSKNRGLKSVAGGPARKQSAKGTETTVKQVANYSRKRVNVFTAPFKGEQAGLKDFVKQFLRMALGKKSQEKRITTLLQAIVRNPIVQGKYGRNKASTARAKGFNRYLIDTGQFFKSIKAKVTRV